MLHFRSLAEEADPQTNASCGQSYVKIYDVFAHSPKKEEPKATPSHDPLMLFDISHRPVVETWETTTLRSQPEISAEDAQLAKQAVRNYYATLFAGITDINAVIACRIAEQLGRQQQLTADFLSAPVVTEYSSPSL